MVLALLTAVILTDQAAKWWAWRHSSWAAINAGGDLLIGPSIGAWYASPVGGTPLFLLATGYLGARALWRSGALGSVPPAHRRSRVPALVGAGLVLAVVLGAANYGAVNYSGVAGHSIPPRNLTGTPARAHWPGSSAGVRGR